MFLLSPAVRETVPLSAPLLLLQAVQWLAQALPMRRYLAITQQGCPVELERTTAPPAGLTVICQKHRRQETSVSVQLVGWWVQCSRNDCTYGKCYRTAHNAILFGMQHRHAPRIRCYYGTATLRLSDYYEQSAQGELF